MLEPHSAYVEANGIRLHYLEWEPKNLDAGIVAEQQDKDAIPLVLLHGVTATADCWRLMAPLLSDNHRIIAFDLRGHGLSEQPENGYDLATIIEDVVAGMAMLGLGQVALVGHSWGARIALKLAALHPALVSHVVLVDGAYMEPRHWPGMVRERYIHQRASRAFTLQSPNVILEALQVDMSPFWSPEVQEIVMRSVRELEDGSLEEVLHPEHQRKIRESLWDERMVLYYSKISSPVLMILATILPQTWQQILEEVECMDEFVAAKGEMALQVARALRTCSIVWMHDTAHDVQLHRPPQLAELISDFMREQP
jgi:pimeloyl-ACP methyl ester carboxylesterase